ncbi:MAG: hypothetical protein U1G07_03565 [Verrucomicrobiota bacterium]
MLTVIFTLDYEIHGDGSGCPHQLMVEPTSRMLQQFDRYGAKLTIMADIAEILRFKDYFEKSGRDDFHSAAILNQLRNAIRGGHDVQLHIHSSYFNATVQNGRWLQDWREYNFAGLPVERMNWMVRQCKEFLESILRPVNPTYRCFAFRAANWSVSPSENVVPVLINNQIAIDTSVFKYGRRDGLVSFDYSTAHHPLLPWRADPSDICRPHVDSRLWEFPIYAQRRWVGAFLTPHRIYRAMVGRFHRIADAPGGPKIKTRKRADRHWLLQKHAWKADFNQCSGRQLIRSLGVAEREIEKGRHGPFVLIGHSKLFTRWNERSLDPFLKFVARRQSRCVFGTFASYGRVADLAFCSENKGTDTAKA